MNDVQVLWTSFAVFVAFVAGGLLTLFIFWPRITRAHGPDLAFCTCASLERAEKDAAYYRSQVEFLAQRPVTLTEAAAAGKVKI